ncbi:MAG: hypothetical protein ACR2O6_09505 [Ilumatobacteraceae bacterium]
MTDRLDVLPTPHQSLRSARRPARRIGGRLAVGVAVLALLGAACSDDGTGPGGGTTPASDTGGSDSGGGDSGGDSGGGDDSGGGSDSGGSDSGGDSGSGDSGGGDSGGGSDSGGSDSGGDSGGSTTPVEETDDGLTTEEWVLLILLGIAAIAIIIGITSAATNRSDKKNAQKRNLNNRLRDVTSGCRWVNDQALPSVLQATTSDQLNYAWGSARKHMVDLEAKIANLAAGTGDSSLDRSLSALGQSVAGLRGAVESNVNLRLQPDANAQQAAIQASAQTVTQRRQQVDDALVPVLAAEQ